MEITDVLELQLNDNVSVYYDGSSISMQSTQGRCVCSTYEEFNNTILQSPFASVTRTWMENGKEIKSVYTITFTKESALFLEGIAHFQGSVRIVSPSILMITMVIPKSTQNDQLYYTEKEERKPVKRKLFIVALFGLCLAALFASDVIFFL